MFRIIMETLPDLKESNNLSNYDIFESYLKHILESNWKKLTNE